MTVVKSFVGRYSDIDFKYDIDRTSDTTARVRCYYRWKFVNNSTHDGIVSFFTFWTAWGLSIQPRNTDFKYYFGGKDNAIAGVTDIKRLSGFEYAGFEKKNRTPIYIGDWNGDPGADSSYIQICDITATINKDTTSIPLYFGLLRPGSGSESSAEDLHWFYAGTKITNANVRTYSSPLLTGVRALRNYDIITADWSPATNIDTTATKIVQYNLYYEFNGTKTVLPSVTSPTTTFTIPDAMKLGGTLKLFVKCVDSNGVESNEVMTQVVKVYTEPVIKWLDLELNDAGVVTAKWLRPVRFDEFATLSAYETFYEYNKVIYPMVDVNTETTAFGIPDAMKKSGTAILYVRAKDSNDVYSQWISQSITKTYTPPGNILVNASYEPKTGMLDINWVEPTKDVMTIIDYYTYTINDDVYMVDALSAQHFINMPVGSYVTITIKCIDKFEVESPLSTVQVGITGAVAKVFSGNDWVDGSIYYYDGTDWLLVHAVYEYRAGEWV